MKRIGIDLGGHKILGACVDKGKILKKGQAATPESRDPEAVGAAVAELVKRLDPSGRISGVGIGIPGMLGADRQRVLKMPNFPGWENIRVQDLFASRLDVEVRIENDANCYALGEGISGLARDVSDYVVFTLGTGIGGGIVINGKLLTGVHGMAGELGHIVAGVFDRQCGCGALGHIESEAGADGIEKKAAPLGLATYIPGLWEGRANYPQKKIWDEALHSLTRGIASIIHILDPELVILGGGMSRLPGLRAELEKVIDIYLSPAFKGKTELKISNLGNDAAVIGAASLVR
jgi:glucokinase